MTEVLSLASIVDASLAVGLQIWTSFSNTAERLLTGYGRVSVTFLLLTLAGVYLIYHVREGRALEPKQRLRGFCRFLQLREVFLHPSARLDYAYWFVYRLFSSGVMRPFYLLLFIPVIEVARHGAMLLESWFGPMVENPDPFMLPLYVYYVYGLAYLLASDLAHYWNHRLSHTVPFLWEFHKVHHSAEVLTPFTVGRFHPFERIPGRVLKIGIVGTMAAVFFYFCGQGVSTATILGTHYLIFFSSLALWNLRHSHIWLSWGPRIEHVIMSPAQHQIHHSADPSHYNKNFAEYFSLWDWLFGSLYVCSHKPEVLEFGLGEEENRHYRSFYGLLVHPIVAAGGVLVRGTRRILGAVVSRLPKSARNAPVAGERTV